MDAFVDDAAEYLSPPDSGDVGRDLRTHLSRLADFLTQTDAGAVFRALVGQAQHDGDVAARLRADHLSQRVAQVELDHLGSRPGPGVPHRAGDLGRAVRAYQDLSRVARVGHGLGGSDDEIGVLERGVGKPVPEREQRVRIDRTTRMAAGQPRAQVPGRLAARQPGQLHRQPAAGHHPARQHPGDRAAALLAREERLHGRGELPGQWSDRVGTAGHQHQHHRFAGGHQDAQQVLLDAGQPQVGDVAALAGGAPAEQAGLIPEHGHHQVGLPGVRGGVREVRAVLRADVAAARVRDRRAR